MDGPLPVDLTHFLLLWDVHTYTGNHIHSCGSMWQDTCIINMTVLHMCVGIYVIRIRVQQHMCMYTTTHVHNWSHVLWLPPPNSAVAAPLLHPP